jgi:hypothetical protein
MKRSVFIKFSTYAAAAVAVPFLNSCKENAFNPAIAQPQFLSHFFDEKTMLETGRVYLKQAREENSKNKIVDLLTNNSSVTAASDEKTVYAAMDKKVQQDFEKGKIAIVDGWILSVTEARQCALYALTQQK